MSEWWDLRHWADHDDAGPTPPPPLTQTPHGRIIDHLRAQLDWYLESESHVRAGALAEAFRTAIEWAEGSWTQLREPARVRELPLVSRKEEEAALRMGDPACPRGEQCEAVAHLGAPRPFVRWRDGDCLVCTRQRVLTRLHPDPRLLRPEEVLPHSVRVGEPGEYHRTSCVLVGGTHWWPRAGRGALRLLGDGTALQDPRLWQGMDVPVDPVDPARPRVPADLDVQRLGTQEPATHHALKTLLVRDAPARWTRRTATVAVCTGCDRAFGVDVRGSGFQHTVWDLQDQCLRCERCRARVQEIDCTGKILRLPGHKVPVATCAECGRAGRLHARMSTPTFRCAACTPPDAPARARCYVCRGPADETHYAFRPREALFVRVGACSDHAPRHTTRRVWDWDVLTSEVLVPRTHRATRARLTRS